MEVMRKCQTNLCVLEGMGSGMELKKEVGNEKKGEVVSRSNSKIEESKAEELKEEEEGEKTKEENQNVKAAGDMKKRKMMI